MLVMKIMNILDTAGDLLLLLVVFRRAVETQGLIIRIHSSFYDDVRVLDCSSFLFTRTADWCLQARRNWSLTASYPVPNMDGA